MHSIKVYLIKTYNPELKKSNKSSDGYDRLDNILNKFDLLDILHDFFKGQEQSGLSVENSNQTTHYYSDINLDSDARFISVAINYGKFGQTLPIYDVESQSQSYQVGQKESIMPTYFIGFFVPKEKNKCFFFAHCIGNGGVKTIFDNQFKVFYKSIVGLNLSIDQMAHAEALRQWFDASITEVDVIRSKPSKDITDAAKMFGMNEIKTKINIKDAASLKHPLSFVFDRKAFKDDNIVRLDESFMKAFEDDIVTVKLENDQKKTHRINISSGLKDSFSIALSSEDIEFTDGNPTRESMENVMKNLFAEYKNFV